MTQKYTFIICLYGISPSLASCFHLSIDVGFHSVIGEVVYYVDQ
jgi:hypothetical protein